MKTKLIIVFAALVVVLAASEYYFLVELNKTQRFYILTGTTIMAIASIVGIFFCYRRLNQE